MEFACSPRVCVGSLWVVRLPPTVQKVVRLIGDSKLSIGVSVSVCGCLSRLSLCGPVMDWRPVQGVPRLSPDDRWDRLQPPRNPTDGLSGYRKWMDGYKNVILLFEYQVELTLKSPIFFSVKKNNNYFNQNQSAENINGCFQLTALLDALCPKVAPAFRGFLYIMYSNTLFVSIRKGPEETEVSLRIHCIHKAL